MNTFDPAQVRTRKILSKNLNTGNVTITKQDMVDYYQDNMKKLVLVDQDGNELESYWGYGLRKLIESARQYKDKEFLLAPRHFANTEEI
jgi:hypothetical protein